VSARHESEQSLSTTSGAGPSIGRADGDVESGASAQSVPVELVRPVLEPALEHLAAMIEADFRLRGLRITASVHDGLTGKIRGWTLDGDSVGTRPRPATRSGLIAHAEEGLRRLRGEERDRG
jgi:hypothetical protein